MLFVVCRPVLRCNINRAKHWLEIESTNELDITLETIGRWWELYYMEKYPLSHQTITEITAGGGGIGIAEGALVPLCASKIPKTHQSIQ